MTLALVDDEYLEDHKQTVLPIEGLPVDDKDLLIKALQPSIQAIAQATKVFDQPDKARELIEAAIATNKSAIKMLCGFENAHDAFFINRGLAIFKVSNYLLNALDAYDSDTKSVADASGYITDAHKAIAKAMK
jgi:hypothetical protein